MAGPIVFRPIERGRRLPLHRQQVDVLLNALDHRGAAILLELALQVGDRFAARAASGAHLSLDFDRRPERGSELRIDVDRAPGQRGDDLLLHVDRVLLGLVELSFRQRPATEPRRRLEDLRRVALLGAAAGNDRLRARQIVGRDRRAHLRDERDGTGRLAGGKQREREDERVHG
jgi:hypothetical protein